MYKFTDNSIVMRNVGIDLRMESDVLTEEFGINVLYIRNCKFVRCRCFDSLNRTGDPSCPLCFGTGHFASIQKIRVIESSNGAYSSTSSLLKTPVGATDQKNEIYYIRYCYNPKERDMVLKVSWDKHGYPVDIIKVLEIVNVYEMRGDKGRVELNGCVVNDRTDLVEQFRVLLAKLPRKGAAQLLKGGKYIWPDSFMN